jgi:hypothetical protein
MVTFRVADSWSWMYEILLGDKPQEYACIKVIFYSTLLYMLVITNTAVL